MTSLEASFVTYLTTARDFLAPVVEQAVASLDLVAGARVLDVGTGGGGALPPLVRAVGTAGNVLAIDLQPEVVTIASNYAEKAGIADQVTIQVGDVVDVLADAATAPEKAFDAIWAADVILPGTPGVPGIPGAFEEPADIVRQMIQAVRPGGIVALFYSNHDRAMFMPGDSRCLERSVRNAAEFHEGEFDGLRHDERYPAWLMNAGFDDVSLRMYPRVGFPIDSDPTIRPLLESFVWPGLRETATVSGALAGLSEEEVDKFQRLLTPGDPLYVLDDPGYFIAFPTILATGRRPEMALR